MLNNNFNIIIHNFRFLQVMWDDVIGEPEGIRSTDCVWNLSHKCFGGTKHYCYLILSVLFGPCAAFCAGMNLACLAFQVRRSLQ